MSQPDILLFVSDQHTARISGFAGDPVVDTPHLDRLARDGTVFDSAYTSCPLCVPARMSFMTGRFPTSTGVTGNGHWLESDVPTIAHAMGLAGYETVLCGRMHFRGPDQHHGFEKRLVGDFTPCMPLPGAGARSDLGPYAGTPAGNWEKLYGGGTSPVLEYDRAVVRAAVDLLAEPHERPLFLVVGIYGPHHTFVAPPELYRKYRERVSGPRQERGDHPMHPVVDQHGPFRELDPEVRDCIRAAYHGMIEHADCLVGEVRSAFDRLVAERSRPGLFAYFSDHGEQAGERGLWGKNTFFEESAAIPMIWAGDGVPSGRRVATPVSMMDIGMTACDLGGAECWDGVDGRSFRALLTGGEEEPDRTAVSEFILGGCPGRMVRWRQWKLVHYEGGGEPWLYDLGTDPGETRNAARANPEVLNRLHEIVRRDWEPEAILHERERRNAHGRILQRWGEAILPEDPWRWKVPESSWELPTQ